MQFESYLQLVILSWLAISIGNSELTKRVCGVSSSRAASAESRGAFTDSGAVFADSRAGSAHSRAAFAHS